jgi:hypothetical protein
MISKSRYGSSEFRNAWHPPLEPYDDFEIISLTVNEPYPYTLYGTNMRRTRQSHFFFTGGV